MNDTDRYELATDVRIDNQFYRMVRIPPSQSQQGGFDLNIEYQDEPPYSSGVPNMLSDPQFTWHLGGFKSRAGIIGTTEYGENVDDRWAFRMLPSSLINDLTLPSSSGTPISIFEALGYIFVVTGRRVYRVDPSTDIVVLSKDFGAALNGVMGVRWEETYALVTTDAATNSLWQLTTGNIVPGGPDTWTQTASVTAYRLASGINRLFKVSFDGVLRNLETGLDPMDETAWGDEVQVGDTFTLPTSLVAYERTVFVGKPEGLFGVGDDGFGLPVIKRMSREVNNCFGMINFDPYLIVPHNRGLYRYFPGQVESIGLERELLNESSITGKWQAIATDNQWLYGAMLVGSNTYIHVGREKTGAEASGFSPIIWDTFLKFTGTCRAIFTSALSTVPRLWFGKGNNLSYISLQDGIGSVEYCLTGSRYLPRTKFDDWNSKDFPKVDLVGKNLDANNYWILNYSLDGGAYSDQDTEGNQMRLNSDGRESFFLPSTAVGREIQLRLDFVYDGVSLPPELNYIEAFGVPQSKKIPLLTFTVILEKELAHDHGYETRTATEQFNDLLALMESPSAVLTTGPWGEDKLAWVKRLAIVTQRVLSLSPTQQGDADPVLIVSVGIQLREDS